ncbi:hypothetical protein PIB30_103044, partial [Stylosanthes scabra]|nr:hypothetical protein [Stylosanthes scabra]
ILDVEEKSEYEELVLEFLTSTEVMMDVLSSADMMKWDKDRKHVEKYLGKKAPGLTLASIKVFLRQRGSRKEGFVSEAYKDVCREVTQPSILVRNVSMKRRKVDWVINIPDKIDEFHERGKVGRMVVDEVEKPFES